MANLCFQSQSHLEENLDAELELARVEGGGRAAVVEAAAGALAEGIDFGEERIGGRFVETIEEIEALCNQVDADAFAETNHARQPHIE